MSWETAREEPHPERTVSRPAAGPGSGHMRITRPNRNVLRSICARLEARLSDQLAGIVRLLGLNGFLSVVTVLERERPAGRLVLPRVKIELARELVATLGLFCTISRSGFHVPAGHDGYDHAGAFVPAISPLASHGTLYFGLHDDFVHSTEMLELHGEHLTLARLFGYPECCARSFAASRSSAFDRTSEAVGSGGPFPRVMNPLTPLLYGIQWLFHFPCSFDCAASLAILHGRMSFLSHLAPQVVQLDRLARGIAIYGPSVGAALITTYQVLDQGEYEIRDVVAQDALSLRFFSEAPADRLLVRSPRDFSLGTQRVADEQSMAAIFF